MKRLAILFLVTIFAGNSFAQIQAGKKIQISGVYPQLATFNEHDKNTCNIDGGENGIGAIVPWANKLWMVTYSPHCPGGSSDKLYSIDSNLNEVIHQESIGGTPANRMIHKESNQLIISSYFIDSTGKIRVIPFSVMPGRMTATARDLFDPANKVYFYDMEGKLYEVNVHTLAVKKLFEKPVPGWHGKGAYTAQHQLVVANNGEDPVFKVLPGTLKVGSMIPKTSEDRGVLASWDGKDWKIIQRRQFTDVTGPGGIYGSPNDQSPLWSIGWDKRSVMLELLDHGKWYTYRLPKATHTYDSRTGWYTEWPRIREVGNGKMLMDMHGMFYNFPKTFSRLNSSGISPIGSHLRYIPDFCYWNGHLVLSSDETTILQNPMAGRAQSNLWFGQMNDLKDWGSATGWGGPWLNDSVTAGIASDPFLINGFDKKVLHLSHNAREAVTFTLEVDKKGDNHWSIYNTIKVPANGYKYFIFPSDFSANWIRIKANENCRATAFFHYTGKPAPSNPKIFEAIAGIDDKGDFHSSLIRPAAQNKNLQVLNIDGGKTKYSEVNEHMNFSDTMADNSAQMKRILAFKKHYTIDNASVIIKDRTGTFRIPMISKKYEDFSYRDDREIESERFMLNIQGTFYEVGRESGYAAMRPITTHKKKIVDFCTWRGLLVLSGTKINARPDGHYFSNDNKSDGLWFGVADDMWKMGKPVGEGGVWKDTNVKAGVASLPYLMTGYDKKEVVLKANKNVTITLEVNTDLTGWHLYKKINISAGKAFHYLFPDGYSAHWIRATADKDCLATAWFIYK